MRPLILYLIKTFLPYIWIHSQEKYYPYDIQNYIDNSELWCNKTFIGNYSNLTIDSITIYNNCPTQCYLQPSETIKYGYHKNISKAPVYAYYSDFDDYFEIKYLFFYSYNGAYNILHLFNYLDINYGDHYGDLEHMTLRFTNQTNQSGRNIIKLDKIYLAAHTESEGEWLSPNQVKWKGSRPIIYSALNGHGSYSKMGCYNRIYGFANDYCNQGTLWDPSEILILNDNKEEWHRYRGDYSIGIQMDSNIKNLFSMTIGNKKTETNITTTSVKRFFYMYPRLLGLTS